MRDPHYLFGTPHLDVRFDPLGPSLTLNATGDRQNSAPCFTVTGDLAVQVAAALCVAHMRMQLGEVLVDLLRPAPMTGAWNAAAGGWYRVSGHMVQRQTELVA